MASIVRGILFGTRLLRHQRAFAACLIGGAAIGLAINTALFAIVDGAFLRDLPLPNAHRLVHLELDPIEFFRLGTLDRGRVADLQQRLLQAPSLQGLASHRADEIIDDSIEMSDAWRSLRARRVSHDFFEVVGVRAAMGRTFVEADSTARPRPVVLSHDLWMRQFGGNRDAVGTVLRIPGTENHGFCEVVGVMPQGFSFPSGVQLWAVGPRPRAPVATDFVGRLADAATIASVRASLSEMTVVPLTEHAQPPGASMSGYLFGASLCAFLVAWLQAGSLLLTRTLTRVPEIRTKLALGATPWRIGLEYLGEALFLLGTATILAGVLAPSINALAVAQLPETFVANHPLMVGARAYVFLVAIATVGAVLLAAVPVAVVNASHRDRRTEHALTSAPSSLGWLRRVVFGAQIAVTTMLLYLAVVVAVSYHRVTATPLGFDAANVFSVRIPGFAAPPAVDRVEARASLAAHAARLDNALRTLASTPGIAAIAGASFDPMRSDATEPALLRPESDPDARTIAGRHVYVGRGFVEALRIPIVSGRDITAAEAAAISESPVTGTRFGLADAALARRLAPFGDPVGQMIVFEPNRRVRIVGVIGDVKLERPDEASMPTLFLFNNGGGGRLLIRTEASRLPRTAIRDALGTVWGADAQPEAHSVEEWTRKATAGYRARALVLTLIVLFAVPVGAIGVVGAAAHVARERRREFAIRLALGSTRGALRRLLLQHFAAFGTVGLTAGIGCAVAVASAMAALLFGVAPADPLLGAAVAALMVGLIALAVLIPSAAIASIDVAGALKDQ